MADRGRRAFPVSSPLLDEHWQQHLKQMHKDRLAKVKGQIDNRPPESVFLKLGAANNPKRAQLIADLEAKRDLENKILLEKLLSIQSRTTLEPSYSAPSSRNTLFKQTQEQLKVLTENARLLRNIELCQSKYNVKQMEQEHTINQRLVARHSMFRGPESAYYSAAAASGLTGTGPLRPGSAPVSRRPQSASVDRLAMYGVKRPGFTIPRPSTAQASSRAGALSGSPAASFRQAERSTVASPQQPSKPAAPASVAGSSSSRLEQVAHEPSVASVGARSVGRSGRSTPQPAASVSGRTEDERESKASEAEAKAEPTPEDDADLAEMLQEPNADAEQQQTASEADEEEAADDSEPEATEEESVVADEEAAEPEVVEEDV